MATKMEFVDGFDGWLGMGSYIIDGDDTMSPWHLLDLTLDLGFDTGAGNYNNMVAPDKGVYGGGALRVPLPAVCKISPRYSSHLNLSWWPIDNYTIDGSPVTPVVPYVVTWGYYLITEELGYQHMRQSVAADVYKWQTQSYEQFDGGRSERFFTNWHLIKQPDGALWGGWVDPTQQREDNIANPLGAVDKVTGFGDKFYSVSGTNTIVERSWPDFAATGTTFEMTLDGQIVSMTHNGDDKFFLLTKGDAPSYTNKVYETDLSFNILRSWTLSEMSDASAITFHVGRTGSDIIYVGGDAVDQRTINIYDADMVHQSSFIEGSITPGGKIIDFANSMRDTDARWTVYVLEEGVDDRTNVLEPASTPIIFGNSSLSSLYSSIYDDGMYVWLIKPDAIVRGFLRGGPLSNVGLFPTDPVPSYNPNWGESVYLEHSYRALGAPSVGGFGVGLATTVVNGVKYPEGVADATVTGDHSVVGARRPLESSGNFMRLLLDNTQETHHQLGTGDVAYLDDFYFKTNDQEPSEDPEDYLGPVRIHTLRPIAVYGNLAPIGTFSPDGYPETINQLYARCNADSYLVAQSETDSAWTRFEQPSDVEGTIAAVATHLCWARENEDLLDSGWPGAEHTTSLHLAINSTSIVTDEEKVMQPFPDPSATGVTRFTPADPYNINIATGLSPYQMAIGMGVSDVNPETGVAWSICQAQHLRVHLDASGIYDSTAYDPWPWTNMDET